MSRLPPLPQKRPHPDSQAQPPSLSEPERKLYELIKSRTNMGIWTADMKKETGLQNNVVTKSLKLLQNKNLIKDVVNVHNKGRKYYMAVEFEPSKEVSGGSWYADGNLDTDFINILRRMCVKHIEERKVATIEDVWKAIVASRVLKVECSMQQILEIVRALALDKEIEELKSTGVGEFSNVQAGKICYRSLRGNQVARAGYLSTIPCGVCPRISECTPDGVISPKTCVYYNKWLKLDF
ncbi:DNA-directed RNA polymerase III subunit rpc6-like [Canna indica]|uniref:DNA-directed RNA polymerase III subunit RPC6 n=1 Tax=Canna indica TaxID=4628 RepID=A0AAQ3PZY0_9LILI|nr:DNA-directed RNA polymerase III subunit rpc6-like [Canna indica]